MDEVFKTKNFDTKTKQNKIACIKAKPRVFLLPFKVYGALSMVELKKKEEKLQKFSLLWQTVNWVGKQFSARRFLDKERKMIKESVL